MGLIFREKGTIKTHLPANNSSLDNKVDLFSIKEEFITDLNGSRKEDLFLDTRRINRRQQAASQLYYGYIIVLISLLLMVVVFGSHQSFGVFFKPMLSEFGWNRETTSIAFSLGMIMLAAVGFISGHLSDRFGARRVVTAAGIIIGAGYVLTSRIQSPWQFYLAYGILASAGTGCIYVPLAALIARWFEKRRGLMSGIAISGFGFGLMAVPPLAARITGWFDWRTAMLIVGIADLILIVALARFLKDQPKQTETMIRVPAAAENTRSRLHNITFKEAVKTRQLWMIAIAWFFYGIFYYISTVHIIPHATDLGMTALDAAGLLTIIGITGVVGRISLGFGGDRIGNKRVVIISFVFLTAAYTGLLLSGSHGMLLVFAIAYGLFHGIGILAATPGGRVFRTKVSGDNYGCDGICQFHGRGGRAGDSGPDFRCDGQLSCGFLLCAVLGCCELWDYGAAEIGEKVRFKREGQVKEEQKKPREYSRGFFIFSYL